MEKDINQTLKKAITAHKEGKLQEAVKLYQEILKKHNHQLLAIMNGYMLTLLNQKL